MSGIRELIEAAKAKREERGASDLARREEWLAARAAEEALIEARAEARRRIRAAQAKGEEPDPADVALVLGE